MKYCAFLRGVNVKGTFMKMAEVCRVFESAGMKNVISILASGNLIFESDQNAESLKSVLESALSYHFKYEAFLFIRNQNEVENILKNSPFEKDENFHIYTFIANPEVELLLNEEFSKSKKAEGEQAEIVDGIFYWKTPKGSTLDSDFGKILGRKNLKDQFTSRNINTFEKIVAKLPESTLL